jgi:RND family efflux transporter MFP subunit
MRTVLRLGTTVIGAALVAVAVITVFTVEWKGEPVPPPRPIRPLKTLVVGEPTEKPGREYPGNVRANEEVDLAFQVAGPLIELNVKNGQEVAKDELLARIDPRDFQNNLDAMTAAAGQRKLDVERLTEAKTLGAATAKEVDDAKAAYDVAEAGRKIAAKALDDTYLRAPFPGLVAKRFVENFQNVRAKEVILRLQDVTHVDVDVNIPEERIAYARRTQVTSRFVATFEYVPGREFEMTVKEFATEADPATQTYRVTFTMPAIEDLTILPGMTATIREMRTERPEDDAAGHLLPINAVVIDGLGGYYVWLVKQGEGDGHTVHRANVTVGEMRGDSVLITDGVSKGDRLAAAGVHFLEDNQKVRLLLQRKQEEPK